MGWQQTWEAALEWLARPLIETAMFTVTTGHVVKAVAVLAATWLVAAQMPKLAARMFSEPDQVAARVRTELVARLVVWLIGLISALEALGLHASAMLDRTLFTVSGTEVTLATVLIIAVLFYVASAGARQLGKIAARAMNNGGVDDAGTVAMVQRLVQYGVVMLAVAVGLETVGIDLNALFTAGAVFAVGLSFALQAAAQNFISGLILVFERAIRPGDIIEIDGRVARVVAVGVRATHVVTRDGEEILVPNSVMVGNAVKSLTMSDRRYRVRVRVGFVYSADVDKTRAVLEDVIAGMPWRDPDLPIRVLCDDFGASSVDWDISAWTHDPWETPSMASELREAVWRRAKVEGLVIAFPQLDIHVDPPVQDALDKLSHRRA